MLTNYVHICWLDCPLFFYIVDVIKVYITFKSYTLFTATKLDNLKMNFKIYCLDVYNSEKICRRELAHNSWTFDKFILFILLPI